MGSKINIQARIKRHSRIFKDSLLDKKAKKIVSGYGYKLMLFIIIFIIPVYPTIASLFQNNSVVDFYRGNVDQSGIIGSYYGGNDPSGGGPFLETYEDSFLSINTILSDARDLSGTNEIIKYTIKAGDNISSIAYKFRVSNNSIYWANNFTKKYVIKPGNIIKIPPVSGLIHQIKKGETLASVAKKYKVEEEKIIKQNLIKKGDLLVAGEVLVIPGAIKKTPKKVYKKIYRKYASKSKYTYRKISRNKSRSRNSPTPYVSSGGNYPFKLKWRKPYSGAWGNCTIYVASYKNVNWRGNANRWIQNARAKGNKTGNTPTIGAIVAFEGRGYNPKYGHVAIVMDIKGDYLVVSEMNYRRINEVTYRKVKINDSRITGYIYVGE